MSSVVTKAINNVDNHALKLFRNVAGLFQFIEVDNKYSDLTITVGNKKFYCHKLILQLNGYDFAADSNLEEQLHEINPDQFYEVLQFMYTGEVPVSTNNISSLLSAACALCMNDLIQICFRFLEDILTKKDSTTVSDETYSKIASIHRRLAIKCFSNFQSFNSALLSATETFMKAVLSSDDLAVENEEKVCNMLISWLKFQTDAGNEVHPGELLPLIRWPGLSDAYIRSNIFTNKILMSDPICVTFLTKMTIYMMSGVQYEGLNSFHRKSTSYASCMMVIGLYDRRTEQFNKVYSIDLQNQDIIRDLGNIPTRMTMETVASVHDRNVYVTGAGYGRDETWKWESSSDWIKCANMMMSRRHHCAAILNSTLYALGGVDANDNDVANDDDDDDDDVDETCFIEGYNIDSNRWFFAGCLTHPVRRAAFATYNGEFIYVFGGENNNNDSVDYVQVFEPGKMNCTLRSPMPRAQKDMRAVLWETCAILLGQKTCYIYNFDTDTWQERRQFKTDLVLFGIALVNTTIYIVGGGTIKSSMDTEKIVDWTDTIKTVSLMDIIDNKPATWKSHGELPIYTIVYSYGTVSLPSPS